MIEIGRNLLGKLVFNIRRFVVVPNSRQVNETSTLVFFAIFYKVLLIDAVSKTAIQTTLFRTTTKSHSVGVRRYSSSKHLCKTAVLHLGGGSPTS